MTIAELEQAEQQLREGLLRIYYLKRKLQAEGAPKHTGLQEEIRRLEARAQELVELWTSLRRERALVATERLLAHSASQAQAANEVLERLRLEIDQRSAERKLRHELGAL